MTVTQLNVPKEVKDFVKHFYDINTDDFEFCDDNDRSNYLEVYYQQDPIGQLTSPYDSGYEIVVDYLVENGYVENRIDFETQLETWKKGKNKTK